MKRKLLALLISLAMAFCFVGLTGCGSSQSEEAQGQGDEPSIFADMAGFYSFTSGAGGWCADVEVTSEGHVAGGYSDTDMGETGEGYSDGTQYYCNFSCKFVDPVEVGDNIYEVTVADLEADEPAGVERIEHETRFITLDPVGLTEGGKVQIYAPGAATADIPEEYLSWCSMLPGFENGTPETLPHYGFYNVSGGEGWFKSDADGSAEEE